MTDNGQLAGIVGTATAIQVTYTLSKGGDPVPNIVTGGIFLVLLIVLGYAFGGNYSIPKAIAGVTLLAVILGKGVTILQQVNKLLTGFATPTKPTNPTRK